MPVISTSFNRFLLCLLVQFGLLSHVFGELPNLDEKQLRWLGERVYANECASDFNCLTSWNEGEDFPSLGIGHFIWYQSGQIERFEETFPALLAHYRDKGIALPQWLQSLPDDNSPWQSREQFYAQIDSTEMQELRSFLDNNKTEQVEFIVARLHNSASTLFDNADPLEASDLRSSFITIANSHSPFGIYALIDYVHFKGTGTKAEETYRGQGWGLVQVLQEMQGSPITLYGFVAAAKSVLEQRVMNAPAQRAEERWLAGWKNRLQSYLPPA